MGSPADRTGLPRLLLLWWEFRSFEELFCDSMGITMILWGLSLHFIPLREQGGGGSVHKGRAQSPSQHPPPPLLLKKTKTNTSHHLAHRVDNLTPFNQPKSLQLYSQRCWSQPNYSLTRKQQLFLFYWPIQMSAMLEKLHLALPVANFLALHFHRTQSLLITCPFYSPHLWVKKNPNKLFDHNCPSLY